MADRFFAPYFSPVNGNGDVLPGGKLFFYVSGTSTPLDTYSDNDLTTANANPVVANGAGLWPAIFLAPRSYKIILQDASGIQVWSADPYTPAGSGTGSGVTYDTVAIARASYIRTDKKIISTNGYAVPGDAPHANWKWSATEPSHQAWFQSADGAYWELADTEVDPRVLGAKGDGSTDDLAAFTAARSVSTNITTSKGTYLLSAPFLATAGTRIDNAEGRIQGTIQIDGKRVAITNSVALPGAAGVVNYAVGTTVFSGNFGAYNIGDLVCIQLTTGGDPAFNQIGDDFGVVTAASGSSLTIDTPTRWGYDAAQISKCTGVKLTGGLTRGDISISGVGSTFAAGDIIRIENITGTDTYDGTTAYFEQVRVRTAAAGTITLETAIAYTYGDVWIVKVGNVDDVQISGGYIDSVLVTAGSKLLMKDIECRIFSYGWAYDFRVDKIRAITDQPRGCGFTYSRNGVVSDVISTDAVGVTDNAAFKMLSCIEVTVDSVRAYNTISNSAQGLYPFFVDGFFTPYKGWTQDCNISNLICGKPAGGFTRSAWFVFMRGGTVSNVTGVTRLDVEKSTNTIFSGFNTPDLSEVKECPSVQFKDFVVKNLLLSACPDSTIGPGIVKGAAGTSSGRCIWIRGSAGFYTTSDRIIVKDITNQSTTAGDVTIFVQNAASPWIYGIRDRAGLTKSLEIGNNTSDIEIGATEFMRNPMDNVTSGYSPAITGATTAGTAVYDLQYGGRQRIGRLLTIIGTVTWNSHTGTGNMQISLPPGFPSKNSPSVTQFIPCTVDGFALTGVDFRLRIDPGSTVALLQEISAAGVISTFTVQAAGTISFNGAYETE